MTMFITLKEIHVYPVKSCRGFTLSAARLDARGIEHDREWMIIDAAKGVFLTQRELPKMALIETGLTESELTMRIPGADELSFPFDDLSGAERKATVWMSSCDVMDCGDAAAKALDDYFETEGKRECRLVRMKPGFTRPKMTGGGSVSLVDAYSIHGISRATLDELNERLPSPIPMDRFRPNLVFDGCPAGDEDAWKKFQIGEVSFVGDFKCIRCAITMVDQGAGEVAGPEPLATLAQYRKMGMKVVFGKYYSHENEGHLKVGSPIEVHARD